MKQWILGAAFLLAAPAAFADGGLDIDEIDGLSADDVNVWVNLEGPMLKLASRALAEDDEELSALVSELKAVRVRVIEENQDLAQELRRTLPEKMNKLRDSGWEPIVQVNEDDENVYIYTRVEDDIIHGLVVVAVDDDEITFVNIEGPIRPEDLDRIWDLPAMNSTGLKGMEAPDKAAKDAHKKAKKRRKDR